MNRTFRFAPLHVRSGLILLFASVASALAQDRFPAAAPGKTTAAPNVEKTAANSAPVPTTPRVASVPPTAATSKFAAVAAVETQDFGVPPTSQLHGEPMHAPTPLKIEGGSVIGTEALYALTQQKNSPLIIFDVLGGERGLPGAQNAQPAGNAGSFNDANQRDLGNYLQQVTQGKRDIALVFYCQNVQCWRSYNAALRAIKLDYTRVYWYRGGIEAWAQAGLPTFSRQ